jgi:hypothetical protein
MPLHMDQNEQRVWAGASLATGGIAGFGGFLWGLQGAVPPTPVPMILVFGGIFAALIGVGVYSMWKGQSGSREQARAATRLRAPS